MASSKRLLSPAWKTPLWVAGLLALQLVLPVPLEQARLALLSRAATPLLWLPSPSAESLPQVQPREWGLMAAAREELLAKEGEGEQADLVLPVMDLDKERGRLLLGGGRLLGLAPDALVLRAGVVVGMVEKVTAHLSSVRLLSARGSRLPVEARPQGSSLPGGLSSLLAILAGDGRQAWLEKAFLPLAFKRGLILHTLSKEGGPGFLVGRVATEGVRPRVDLAALPGGPGFLAVAGLGGLAPELFEERSWTLLSHGGGMISEASIAGPGGEVLQEGSAVVHEGVLLGVVASAVGGAAALAPPLRAGREQSVRILARGQPARAARLRGLGGGRARISAWLDPALPSGAVVVVTAGGQELVPPWLLLGRGRLRGGRLTLATFHVWPRKVTVVVFRYPEERQRLEGAR